ncbi:Uncharacterized protein XB16_2240 [Leptospira santarosai]|uniref:PF06537 domain protein n=1 Tax=Leptospira santarosai TaxID=28183 RepID=A0A2P1QUJ0_9LEPT|nr:Uncharacterized protein XB16_2240 [Leptospira santarosai]
MTSFEFGSMAFRQFARNAPLSSISQYTVGQTVFEVPWIPGFSAAIPDRDGLGLLFHTNARSACHAANGRTLEEDQENLTSSLVRLSVGNDSSREEPNYGGQFQPNYVRNLNGIGATLGRFGWKANNTDLTRQSSAAFLGDLGITSPMFQNENCTDPQVQCRASRNGDSPEITHNRIAAISNYLKLIAVPARRKADNESVLLGKKIFFQAGCKNCHLPKIQTGLNESFPELSNQTIHPYTDLLLHDMGEGLEMRSKDKFRYLLRRLLLFPPAWFRIPDHRDGNV